MDALWRALQRFGGIMVAPRATARVLRPGEGRWDGLAIGLLYLAAVGTLDVLRGVAAARVTADLGGVLMLLSAVGRVLLVPIVVLVACETVLGHARAHRRALMLVPLLLVVTAAHELAAHGMALPTWVPEITGGVLSVALAWWVRPVIEPQEDRP